MKVKEAYQAIARELMKLDGVKVVTGPYGSKLKHYVVGDISFTPCVYRVKRGLLLEMSVVRRNEDGTTKELLEKVSFEIKEDILQKVGRVVDKFRP